MDEPRSAPAITGLLHHLGVLIGQEVAVVTGPGQRPSDRPDPIMLWPAWPDLLEPCECRRCRKGGACRFRTELMRNAISEQRAKLDAIVARLNAWPVRDSLRGDLAEILASVGGGPRYPHDEQAYR